MRFSIVHKVASRGAAGGDDRVAVIGSDDHVVIAVADGAGGIGSGSRAADAAVQHVRQRFDASGRPEPLAVLRDADAAVRAAAHGGQTTLVLLVIDPSGVTGGSVGDSEAWIVGDASFTKLTERQRRKPLLGSGEAVVIPFGAGPVDGTLVVASDGLFKYASAAKIVETARSGEMEAIPGRLIDLVRLRSGSLPDDVAVVVCRPVREPR